MNHFPWLFIFSSKDCFLNATALEFSSDIRNKSRIFRCFQKRSAQLVAKLFCSQRMTYRHIFIEGLEFV
ncbi:hypothetical protein Pfo_010439 [Paulownia fortunei]|nr:hypothetical protein Pfo_010439 [Paulownia fortunei]